MARPTRTQVRRRRAAIAALATAALAGGVVVGGGNGNGDGERAARPAASATATPVPAATPRPAPLRRAAGRLVIMRFVGTELPAYVARALRAGRAAGVVLFRDNVASPEQLRALTDAIHAASGDALVMTDQEGGEVRIVRFAGPERSASAQAAAGTVRADSEAAGRQLAEAGIDVVLAPVADPVAPGSALAGRGFGAAAAEAVPEAVAGFRAGGVAATAKHFPGLGTATANTDDAPATITGEPDLRPFAAAIEARVPLVMLSHATYPAYDGGRIASQSRAIVDGLLRDRLGFRGVAITDSMEAEAVIAGGEGVDAAAERSVRAGADLILTTGRGSYLQVHRRLLATARRDEAFAARVRESAARVARLQRSLR